MTDQNWGLSGFSLDSEMGGGGREWYALRPTYLKMFQEYRTLLHTQEPLQQPATMHTSSANVKEGMSISYREGIPDNLLVYRLYVHIGTWVRTKSLHLLERQCIFIQTLLLSALWNKNFCGLQEY